MTTTTKWTDEFLDHMRTIADPVADSAAASVFDEMNLLDDEDKKKFSLFIREFASQDFSLRYSKAKHEFEVPTDLDAYFAKLDALDFNHEEKMMLERASELFLKHGPAVIFTLGVRSLLKQYAHTQAVQVLRVTTLLEQHTHRRIIETMQFVMDVMSPDWHHEHEEGQERVINTNHAGVNSIQKLRLVHAMIRYRINHNMYDVGKLGPWDENWGNPINQEDMIFATQTFSVEVIQGLQQMGVQLSDEEIEDYFGAWQLIGRALGVHTDLLADNYEEGKQLQQKIYDRHFTMPNKYGPVLSEALIQWLDDIIPLATRKTILSLIDHINGPANRKLIEEHLQIDLDNVTDDLMDHMVEIDIPGAEDPGMKKADGESLGLLPFFSHFIDALLKTERGGKGTNFRIGDGFISAWNINEDAERPSSNIALLGNLFSALFSRIVQFVVNLFKKK